MRALYENPGVLRALRAAREWGVRPLLYLTGRGKRNRWTRQDRVLSEALLEYEKGLTGDGLPWYVASDPGREFVLDEVMDEAAAVREEAEAEYRKGNNVSPGLRLVVIDKGVKPSS